MRRYWIDAIQNVFYDNGSKVYEGCTLDEPTPYFTDRTTEIDSFWSDIKTYELKNWLKALSFDELQMGNPRRKEPIMLPNVLCPWGCSEFCFRAEKFNLGIIIQRHLTKVQLNFPFSSWYERVALFDSARMDYIREENDYDTVLLNKNWKIVPTAYLDLDEGLVALVCRNHHKHSKMKRLYLHPPRKPRHNLSAERADELSHCQMQPLTCVPMKRNKYTSSFQMNNQIATWGGIDSATVGMGRRFSARLDYMNSQHEILSMVGRGDIVALAWENVKEGKMIQEYVDGLIELGRYHYPDGRGSIESFTHGSTYVSPEDAMDLQMESTQAMGINVCVYPPRMRGGYELINCQRSWLPMINYIQMEDKHCLGYPMKAIDKYSNSDSKRPVMMLWSLAGIITGCKELWRAIDGRHGPFDERGWDGYFLTHLTHRYMSHVTNRAPKGRTPFKQRGTSTTGGMLTKIERFLPPGLKNFDGNAQEDRSAFFWFEMNYWFFLFPSHDYP